MLKIAAIDGEVSSTPRKKARNPKRETKATKQSNTHVELALGRAKPRAADPKMRKEIAEKKQTYATTTW